MSTAAQSVTVRHVWPLLAVERVERSIDFYRDMLGFSVAGRADVDGRPFWCRLERGGASIMLQRADEEDGPVRGRGRGITFYFVCDDAERLRGELSSRGLQLPPPLVAQYGMVQLFVPEPDGYAICFESPTESWSG